MEELVNMLNPHTRRAIGKCAVDLYEAGNRRESLELLRRLAEASEGSAGDCGLGLDWREAVRSGARRSRVPVPPQVKAFFNV
jgi:hypothetical protein